MDDQLQKAKDAAYRYLSYRARSVVEVRDKLTEKEFAAEIVAEVVADLQRQKLLDDREFARRWVEARLQRANGARKLAQDLRHKGVAADVIDEGLCARFERTGGRAVEQAGLALPGLGTRQGQAADAGLVGPAWLRSGYGQSSGRTGMAGVS